MIIRVGEIDSTQRVARALLDDGAAHGTVVVAQAQTAGRGRRGRTWLCAEDGLYASWVLRPGVPAKSAARVTMAAAAALVRALDTFAVQSFVKWPNDVVIAHQVPGPFGPFRKVAGALVEIVSMSERLDAAVLGVGVNVRGAPAEERAAAALSDAGFSGSVEDVLQAFHPRLLEELEGDPMPFVRARSATLSRDVEVDGVRGRAIRIDDDGALVLLCDDGERTLR
jgi:BirA family biotin operon repressor/biotin-[acetyl-CoA-carboxylase] ligase